MVKLHESLGIWLLTCERLHASLTPASCRDNFKNKRTLSCLGCPIGAELEAEAIPVVAREYDKRRPVTDLQWKKCLRCGRQSSRVIAFILCVSCYNRAREASIGRNGKGQRPTRILQHLQQFTALVSAPQEALAIARRSTGRLFRIVPASAGVVQIAGYTLSEPEAGRMIAALIPGANIVEIKIANFA